LTGRFPVAIAVNQATNRIYIVNQQDYTVSVIDGSNDSVIATVPSGYESFSIAVNPITNLIYVTNFLGNDVTVIDGVTHATKAVPVGSYPVGIAIDTAANKIYLTNDFQTGAVTVIDGATNATHSVAVGKNPNALGINPVTKTIYVTNSQENTVSVIDATTFTIKGTIVVGLGPTNVVVNPLTNRIYVASYSDQNVSVINGASNTVEATIPLGVTPKVMALNPVTNFVYVGSIDYNSQTYNVTRISDTQIVGVIPIHGSPKAIVVNPVTNKIYLADGDTQMTMIDGADNTIHELMIGYGYAPAIAINLAINRVYVANSNDNTVSVVAGANSSPLQFVSLPPCRLVDTRHGGGGAIQGGTSQSFTIPQLGGCNVSNAASVYSLNVMVVPHGGLAYVSLWPTGEDQPLVSTVNSIDGRIKANAAIMPAGYQGAVTVYVTNTTDVILDINGYFQSAGVDTNQFFPLAPCRVVDTRHGSGDLKDPFLVGRVERDFPVLESTCIPQGANIQAYSFNFTAVPHPSGHALGYLSVWPAGGQRPVVSTLNNLTGTIVANAAIVPAGSGGGIAVYPEQDTDLVIDINGYFAAGPNGLSLYPAAPCRAIDTRRVGNGQPFSGDLIVNVGGSICGPPGTAEAYVFNATVVPTGSLGYLTLWPNGQSMPVVSTLNAVDGWITSNMAIVPTMNGSIDAYVSGLTQLILDISSYFAP